jgi:hypothetical protein
MSQREADAWLEYYSDHPFDDYHRHYRPAALISRSMAGAEIDGLLEWLEPSRKGQFGDFSDADMATFKAFGVKPPRKE